MLSANDVISRMSPTTLVALLGDLTEMGNLDHVDCELISLVAYQLLADVGGDAFLMLTEADVNHPLIDRELAMWQEEMEDEL